MGNARKVMALEAGQSEEIDSPSKIPERYTGLPASHFSPVRPVSNF